MGDEERSKTTSFSGPGIERIFSQTTSRTCSTLK